MKNHIQTHTVTFEHVRTREVVSTKRVAVSESAIAALKFSRGPEFVAARNAAMKSVWGPNASWVGNDGVVRERLGQVFHPHGRESAMTSATDLVRVRVERIDGTPVDDG